MQSRSEDMKKKTFNLKSVYFIHQAGDECRDHTGPGPGPAKGGRADAADTRDARVILALLCQSLREVWADFRIIPPRGARARRGMDAGGGSEFIDFDSRVSVGRQNTYSSMRMRLDPPFD